VTVELTTFYLSPRGNDAWSGRLPEPNAEGTDGPFATFAPALEASHRLWAKVPRRIVLRGGNYYGLTLELGPRDSGLTIEAMPGERPILYGGVPLTGWRPDGDHLWAVDLPQVQSGGWDFRMLQVNGRFCPRARLPREGVLTHESEFPVRWMTSTGGGWERKPTEEELTTLKYKEGDLGPWLETRNAEITVYHAWDDSLVGVKSLDPATRTVRFSTPAGHPPGAFAQWLPRARTYVVWNVREGMTQPGQWYLDRAAGKVVYWPLPGEDMTKAVALAPTQQKIIAIQGQPEAPVKDLTIKGLSLAVTNTPLVEASFGAERMPGAITGMDGLVDCQFVDLRIVNVAGTGIKVRDQPTHRERMHSREPRDSVNRRVTISGCEIRSTGAGGIYLTAVDSAISENLVQNVGLLYPAAIGVRFTGDRIVVSHNEISDCTYSGIAGHFGYGARVEYNDISRVMQVLRDGAAIYVFYVVGLTMRGNYAHDIAGGPGNPSHAYYLDEHSENCVVCDNVSVGVPWAWHNHMAWDNAIWHNVFIVEGDALITFPRSHDFVVGKNVIYATGSITFDGINAVDRFLNNIFYSATGVVKGLKRSPERELVGEEALISTEDTLLADPQLTALAGREFAFQPDSPAHRLGITPLEVKTAGRSKSK